MLFAAGLAFLSVLILNAPPTQGAATPGVETPIPPVVWEAVHITRGSGRVELTHPARHTVQFLPEGELAVGANSSPSAGSYTVRDGSLDIQLAISNPQPYATDAKIQEEAFLELLNDVTRYEFNPDGYLELAADDESLLLRARLTGVVWIWQVSRASEGSRIEPKGLEEYTLTFLPGGNLILTAGCIRSTAAYSTDGAVLEIRDLEATKDGCPHDLIADQYLRDLDEVTSHVFREGNLYLALWADAGIMEFTADYQGVPQATPQPESFVTEPG